MKITVALCVGLLATLEYCSGFPDTYSYGYGPKADFIDPLATDEHRRIFVAAIADTWARPFGQLVTQVSGVAELRGGPGASGVVRFYPGQRDQALAVTGYVEGVPEGKYLAVVTQFGDLTNPKASFGPIYNPYKLKLHDANDTRVHVGDLGTVEVGKSGAANFTFFDDYARLVGPFPLLGRVFALILICKPVKGYGKDYYQSGYGKDYQSGYGKADYGKDSYQPGYGKDSYQPGYGKDSYQPGYGKDSYQPGYGKDSYQAGYGKDSYQADYAKGYDQGYGYGYQQDYGYGYDSSYEYGYDSSYGYGYDKKPYGSDYDGGYGYGYENAYHDYGTDRKLVVYGVIGLAPRGAGL